jgi:O-antigen/teichoic acid export membrane protein
MRHASVPRGRHALSGAIHILLADALFVPTGLLTAAFLTRQLGPEGYGRLSLATAVTVWLEWIILSAFSRATIKFIGEADDWRPVGTTTLRVQLLSGTGGGLVLALLAGPIAAVLKEPRLVLYLRLFALDIAATALATVHRQILVGLGEFTR